MSEVKKNVASVAYVKVANLATQHVQLRILRIALRQTTAVYIENAQQQPNTYALLGTVGVSLHSLVSTDLIALQLRDPQGSCDGPACGEHSVIYS